jgi:ferredoxin--NADP+ reductase
VRCRFLVSPIELTGKGGRLTGVRLQHNELFAAEDGTPRPRSIDRYDTEDVQLLFKAIGYRGVPIPGVPFHERWGIIPNRDGRVLDGPDGAVVPHQYVVGWAKRGPTGLIGTNSPDSKDTVAVMLRDLAKQHGASLLPDDAERIVELLQSRGVDFVSYADWQRLDEYEIARGRKLGKVRDKLTSVDEMMAVIAELRAEAGAR